jgi:hypothetical protein
MENHLHLIYIKNRALGVAVHIIYWDGRRRPTSVMLLDVARGSEWNKVMASIV